MARPKRPTEPKPIVHKDGTIRWRVRFRLAPSANPVSETFDDQNEAIRFAKLVDAAGGAAARRARDAATAGVGRSLQAAFDSYLIHAGTSAQKDTLDKYRNNWNLYIQGPFGAWPLDAISREAIEAWIGDLRGTETQPSARRRQKDEDALIDYLSPKTIANIHGLLSAVFKNEVMNGRLAVNPAYGIALPQKQKKRQPVFLSHNQYSELASTVPRRWRPLVNLIASTGLRWSEATALIPEDFDLDGPQAVVRISRAWKRGETGKGWYRGAPKTDHGYRSISLAPSVLTELLPTINQTADGELLFPGPSGGRLRGEWFHERVWRPALAATTLPRRPVIHDLRHSHASWLIAQGVPLTIIQRRLGHSSIKVTSDIYGHLAPDAWQIAAEATEMSMALVFPAFEPDPAALIEAA